MKTWRLVAGVLLLGLLLRPAQPVRADSRQVWVDDSYCLSCSNDGHTWRVDAFATISEAVRAVQPGGTIRVAPGRYQEDVRLGKPCALIAEQPGSAVLEPRAAAATIVVATNDATIEGLEIVGSRQAAILIVGPSFQREPIRQVAVRGNVIRGGFFGVAANIDLPVILNTPPTAAPIPSRGFSPWVYGLLPAAAIEVSNNAVSGCKRAIYSYNTTAEIAGNSISGLEPDGIGIYSSQGSVSRIRANTVQVDALNGRAISILDNKGTAVEGNTLLGSTEYLTPTTALALYSYSDLLVRNNTLRGFYSGVQTFTGGSARIVGNTFDGALGWSLGVGTAITETKVTVEGNTFRGSYLGLHLDDDGGYGLEATVQGNTFADNVVGIQLAASTRKGQVEIHGNSICGNLAAGLRNESAEVVDATGNWWGANDGPKPGGFGDRVEGLGGALVNPWLRLLVSARSLPDGQVRITASLGNSRYHLRDQSLTFNADHGAFVETDSAVRTTLTDILGDAQATLYPLLGTLANVTVRSGCGETVNLSVPAAGDKRTEPRNSSRPGR